MSIAENLAGLLPGGRLPKGKRIRAMIHPDRVLDGPSSGAPIDPDRHYFAIRLIEMDLKDRVRLWQEFDPIAVILSRFDYDGATRDVPFIVSSDLLKPIAKQISDAPVGLRNVQVVGPVPYKGKPVGLYFGLHAARKRDLVEHLLGSLGTIFNRLQVQSVAAQLALGQALYRNVLDLLRLDSLEYKCGNYQEFSDLDGDHTRFRDSYQLDLVTEDETLSAEQLWVRNGELLTGADAANLSRIEDCDYCLVKIDGITARGDYHRLPFHETWTEVQSLIQGQQFEDAKVVFLGLMRALPGSPDITNEDRFSLVKTYTYAFDREVEAAQLASRVGTGAKSSTRAGRSGKRFTGKAFFGRAASVAKRAGLPDYTLETLNVMAETEGELMAPEAWRQMLREDRIGDALQRVREAGPKDTERQDAESLARAIQFTLVAS